MSDETRDPNESGDEGAGATAPGAAGAAPAEGGKGGKGARDEKDGKAAKGGKGPAAKDGAKPAKPAAPPVRLPALPYALIGVVLGALAAGAALGLLLVGPRVNALRHDLALKSLTEVKTASAKKPEKKKEKKKEGEAGKTPVYKLDNIIVNPAGSQGQRFLMCSIAIESDDKSALDLLREHEVELRDRVVTLLSQQSLDRLTAESARDSLRAELLRTIHPVLGPDGKDTELKVFLPQFVVQ